MKKIGIKNDEDFVEIPRTPEVEQYIVEQVYLHLSLGNMIKSQLPKELFDNQEPKGLIPIEFFEAIINGVVEMYDCQFGLKWAEQYPELMKKLAEALSEKTKAGRVEVV